DEHFRAVGKVIELHDDSKSPNSGSLISRSSVSKSPFQGIIPAVCRAIVGTDCTVTWTLSCSLSGSGAFSLRVPFSYVASTVRVITASLGGASVDPRKL